MGAEGFMIVSVFFVIGGFATWLVNRRAAGVGARQRWTKYWAYVIIVFAMMALIQMDWVWWASLVLATIGFWEVIAVASKSRKPWRSRIVPTMIFSLIVVVFLNFASHQTSNTVLFVYVVVLTFDGFSQVTGQLFGKNKLVAKLSPGKTVEGLIGGFAMALFAGWLMRFEVPQINVWVSATFVSIAALAGDLLASYYKRWCGVKDYSDLIPGHGGVLDRFDSFFGAAVAWELMHRL